MRKKKNIVLIAHDNLKLDLLDWARSHRKPLNQHNLFATGTTGKILSKELSLKIHSFHGGPMGGDLQIGAKIAAGEIDIMIFFLDPLSPHPHDVDIKALLRIAAVYDVAVAIDRATSDFIISSPYFSKAYKTIPLKLKSEL